MHDLGDVYGTIHVYIYDYSRTIGMIWEAYMELYIYYNFLELYA